jgi:hypothetical protein
VYLPASSGEICVYYGTMTKHRVTGTRCSPPVVALLVGLFSTATPLATEPGGQAFFSEVSQETGLIFHHFNGMSGEFYLAEIMGPGVALLDYDNDGDLDVYLVQGSMLGPGKTPADAKFPPPAEAPMTDRLYRNDLLVSRDGPPTVHFTDVSTASGIRRIAYGMGVASADIDNDGWVDLYVTNFGKNQLLRNRGDGSFEDITDKAGVGDPGWSVSAAFFDFDRDGWLDLYVGNYVELNLEHHKQCFSSSSAPDYCTPLALPAVPDRLYRNRGNGTFKDVSRQAGIAKEHAPALGVVAADYDGDGREDVYVANDSAANLLWLNQGDGTFRNGALLAGVAVNMSGAAEGSMGLASGDFDNDGDEDLFMTNLTGETNTVYVNDGRGWFAERSIRTGLAGPSKPYTGFGTAWLDVDNDGWLDVWVANGEVSFVRSASDPSDPFPLHQINQLFMNRGGKGFEEVKGRAGGALHLSEVSRGAAFGDIDNDGDTDIVLANNNGPVRLLHNQVGHRAHWLGLRLLDRAGRDALGARVEVRRLKDSPLWRTAATDGSYASASDPRVLVGLGEKAAVEQIIVHWPNGRLEAWAHPAVDRYTTLRQGQGRNVKP